MFAYRGSSVGFWVLSLARTLSSRSVASGRQVVDSQGREARFSLDLNPSPTVFVFALDRLSVFGHSHLIVVVVPAVLAWLVTSALVA